MEDLIAFIQENPDPRELKRAIAVQMVMQNYTHSQVGDILQVSVGFVNKWKYVFLESGVRGLKLKYLGSKSYFTPEQRQTVIQWLKNKRYWHLSELKEYIKDSFNINFASNQSYYELFKKADISWKKTQKENPKLDPELVAKKNWK